jgi:hypothetical protein
MIAEHGGQNMSETATLTLVEFEKNNCVRFRRNAEEIKNGLSREEAFETRLASGNVSNSNSLPRSVWENPTLTIHNFSEVVLQETGVKGKRFRMTREQTQAVKNGTMTREEAFEAKKQEELSNEL